MTSAPSLRSHSCHVPGKRSPHGPDSDPRHLKLCPTLAVVSCQKRAVRKRAIAGKIARQSADFPHSRPAAFCSKSPDLARYWPDICPILSRSLPILARYLPDIYQYLPNISPISPDMCPIFASYLPDIAAIARSLPRAFGRSIYARAINLLFIQSRGAV